MRDVAAAARVSVATVSNVLNHPHLVAARTRTRVEKAVHALGFQPDPHARELRSRSRTGAGVKNPRTHLDGEHSANEPDDAADGSALSEPGHVAIRGGVEVRSGEHITVQVGSEMLSGTVDAVMPDNSYFWIWADSGMGRRLIETAAVSTNNELT
ncbi:helix-turn-helix domain-containing protein [Pseudarthrobacter oxydans]|uniref:LacI family DNA-binding transcriptional regulator n=1 Tax=Pseudarthrobacter oxydans TaxID=1671 RepID=UPI003D2AF51F